MSRVLNALAKLMGTTSTCAKTSPLTAFSIELEVTPLREGYIHELRVTDLRSKDDDTLTPDIAHYTLNKIPAMP